MIYNLKKLKGKKVGIVFGCYAPMHQGHLDVIYKAKKECDAGVMVIVCGYDGDRGEKIGLSLKERFGIIDDFFKQDKLVSVCGINDTELGLPEYPNGWKGWLEEVEINYKQICSKVEERVWYVGEKDYKDYLEKLGEKVVLLDRSENQISATKIRNNPTKYWGTIIAPFKPYFSKNILITGTASEGKTTLVEDLARYFDAPYTSEYGKDFLESSGIDEHCLNKEHYLHFLNKQWYLTARAISSSSNKGVVFCDTDNLITKMYAKYYSTDNRFLLNDIDFKSIEKEADRYTEFYEWDKIFLIVPHNKFVDDGIRCMEHADIKLRNEMFELLISYIKEAGLWEKVVILNGNYYENFKTIVNYVKGLY